MEAVPYYNIFLPFFADVVNQLDGTEAAAIKTCQTILENYDYLDADVTYLDSNFVGLKFVIKTLEKDDLPLADALVVYRWLCTSYKSQSAVLQL